MTWSCSACTVVNSDDKLTHCNVCQTKRRGTKSTAPKTTTQRTLFGTKVDTSKVTATKTSRKRKATALPASEVASTLTSTFVTSSKHRFASHVRPKSSIIDSQEIQNILQEVFGLQKLRNLQPQVVECALKRSSQLLVLATGGGKSLCYQLPACLLGGITIVISPLIALMLDQVKGLQDRKIPAACVCSSQTESQNKAILKQAADPKNPLTLLYITPESIQTDRMRTLLKQLYKESRLAMFAVDEAHCLSR